MNVVPRLRPEPGKNFDLKTSLDRAAKFGTHVMAWGPYRIKKELYDSALRRIQQLNSGAISYKMVDAALSPSVNCIHALADLDVFRGHLATGTACGAAASAVVARHFGP